MGPVLKRMMTDLGEAHPSVGETGPQYRFVWNSFS